MSTTTSMSRICSRSSICYSSSGGGNTPRSSCASLLTQQLYIRTGNQRYKISNVDARHIKHFKKDHIQNRHERSGHELYSLLRKLQIFNNHCPAPKGPGNCPMDSPVRTKREHFELVAGVAEQVEKIVSCQWTPYMPFPCSAHLLPA